MLDGESPHHNDIDLGIALYKHQDNDQFDYQWALVAVERPSTYSNPDVHVYEIRNRDQETGERIPWFTCFTRRSLLTDASSLLGVVHLATLDMPINHLDGFITELGPGPNGYNTKDLGWTNATWVIRIVEALAEGGFVDMPSTIGQFKINIQEKGARLEVMKSWGYPLPVLNA
jgi:hypothetical protein